MEIILLEQIDNVGGVGDKVAVKSGYDRNYLIPQGKATLATPENIAKFEARRSEIEAKAHTELEAAQARAGRIEGQVLRVRANAGPEGKLFGSVGTPDIAEACQALGFDVERSEIRLADGPLRFVGEHQIELHFRTDVNVPVTVVVEAQEGEAWVDDEDQSDTTESSESAESTEPEGAEEKDDT